ELARIVTAPTGTVTIGDSTQTGDITFSGATVATTAGADTTVLQSTTGDGQIVLDDSNGTALDGNGGSIGLTAGTGGIAALHPANATAEIATTGAGVTLNTTGPIGTAANPIQFADNTNTAQQVVAVGAASTAYLDGLGSLTLGSVTGGTANTALTVTARTNLVVAANATINTGTATLSLGADLQADGSGDDGGVGTLSVDAGANLYGASITLRGAEVNIASTANVGSATSQSPVSTFVPSNAGLDGPYCMSFDASGNLYVANAENDTISKVTPGGTVSTFVSSGLSGPIGLAFDSSGNLYVVNGGANTISKVTPAGVVTTLVSGLNGPADLAFDSGGALYITNFNGNTISKVTAIPATTQVTIQSSLPSRPMSLGGSNDAAVDGINLTSAELARIVTAPTGTVTIGDPTQTGDITFSGATVATTAGAATDVVQSPTGDGQVVLDDSNGTALDGNGGSISLTAGTGGIAALNPANTTAEIATTGAGVTLNTTGPIGAAGYPIQFADNSNTAQQVVAVGGASAAYLDGLGNLTLGSVAGSTANTALTVTARTNLVVADNATINTGTATLSLGADLQADGSGDDGGVGTLSVDAGANLYGASITLRGAEVNIASTANVGSATSQSPVSTFVPSNAGLDGPYCMSFDASGNLYVANAENNTISKVTPAGTVSTFVSSGLSDPSGLAFDSSGNLYVANYSGNTISKVTPGGTVSTFVSSGLSGPGDLAFDASGNLYVANYSGNTISKVTPGGTVSTFVSSGLSGPGGLAFDASG